MTWVIVFVVVVVVIGTVWIGNTVRWTRRTGQLKRKSPLDWGPGNYESKPAAEHAADRQFVADRLEAHGIQADRLDAERVEAERVRAERVQAERRDAA
jgi:hypothetical protein